MNDLRTIHKNKILQVDDLPTLPDALAEVSRLVEDPNSSTEQIARVISHDQVLSAKILKMVNSPIYGFPGRIGSISHALVLLGFNVIKGVIISTSVFDTMNTSMAGLWEHSVGCALASAEVARVVGLKDPEEYSVCGLLHDLGKVVLAVQLPELKVEIDAHVADEDMTYREAEQLVLGFDHERINAWLADYWHLPPMIKDGMSRHHVPLRAQHYPAAACVVHIGDFLVRLYEYGSGGDDTVLALEPKALKLLKFGKKELERTMDALSEKFIDVAAVSFA
ncbi:HDOD domain-containing protein [Oceanidesulfovibrio marinus]|uniref:HDOD domain-containing protein n=1 Tax=Oceanidesulfovibrio marinus TaxID=370038 RepID=A0A6P1ZIU6_9BACT|nr:HDOD domain-containing protein [Oceanidesulfovibrio marinus]QJT08473.1 HDOD domain-containing protein [Oceanidesulfovibrio marinus]TVM33060.1 HDOD domain-containing protein [Oceanidesulfovibrio marinus]